MNRRDLLLSAGAGALGLAAAPGEIKVIRAGILGTRHSHTRGKLEAMKASSDYEVAAVCEPDAATREQAQKNPMFQGLRWMTEDELLSDPSIHLVVVECSVWEALPQGKKVIAAGKHLHLEKPPGNDWRTFRELVEEARRRKLLLQTGYVWRSHQGVSAAIEAAKKGWLGEVFMVRGTMNSDRDAEQRAVEAKYRGGSLFELGGHVIDRTVELLGRPKNVKHWLRHDTSYPDQLADNTLVVFEYEKALAVISSSARMYGSGDHRSFEVLGSDGTAIVNPEAARPRLRVAMRKPQGPYRAGWQDVEVPPQPRFVGDFNELARALKTGTPLRLSYDHELLLQETLLRASGELS
jgi:predicted dehydrogenase